MNERLWKRLERILGLDGAAGGDRALERAYARFHAIYPQWTASLFDWHFITHHAAPILLRSSTRFSDPAAARVARAWAEQWGIDDPLRHQAAARALPAARGFITLLQAELARLPDPSFANNTVPKWRHPPLQPADPKARKSWRHGSRQNGRRRFKPRPQERDDLMEAWVQHGKRRDPGGTAGRQRLFLGGSRRETEIPPLLDRALAEVGRRLARWGRRLESSAKDPASPNCRERPT